MNDRHKSNKLMAGVRYFSLLAITLMIMTAIPVPEAAAEEGETLPVGRFLVLESSSGFLPTIVDARATASEEDNPQLLGTNDDGEYVDFKANYVFEGIFDEVRSHFHASFFIYTQTENGSWECVGNGQVFHREYEISLPHGDFLYCGIWEGIIEPWEDVPFNTEKRVDYRIEFSVFLGNSEGESKTNHAVGYAYTDPALSQGV